MDNLIKENKYCKELQALKPYDPIQSIDLTACNFEYPFITTAGHGYLVVEKNSQYSEDAKRICKYGFIGELAYYLEEDCEAPEFVEIING